MKELTYKNGQDSITISAESLDKMKEAIIAIQNPTREQILEYLSEVNEADVTSICTKLTMEASAISRHLGILYYSGLVSRIKKGRFTVYAVNMEAFLSLDEAIHYFIS